MNTRDWFKVVWMIIQIVLIGYMVYILLAGGEEDWNRVFPLFILSQLSLLELDMQDIKEDLKNVK